ncbi:MAG: flavin reductase family protein [Candidatus Margulisbacteria bacterium]|nr:flavin reductase family protein [Candidatus Margulisiibacteriota bacterium]
MDKSALFKLGYGVYIVSSFLDKKYNGQIATVVFQVTSQPARIATCINKENLTHGYIEKSGFFGVSVLEQDTPIPFIGKFGFKSGRDKNKFEDTKYEIGETGTPLVTENSVAIMEAKVINQMDIGTHTMFIGEIQGCKNLSNDIPLTYDYYHNVKKMKSPKAAPTYNG